jgi:hypothetical protein
MKLLICEILFECKPNVMINLNPYFTALIAVNEVISDRNDTA